MEGISFQRAPFNTRQKKGRSFFYSRTHFPFTVYLCKSELAIAMEIGRTKLRGELPFQLPAEISDYVSRRPKGLLREFFYDINPISREDWRMSGIFFKIILIIRSPFMLLMQLFVPVVSPVAEKRDWSKLLNCFQLCVVILFMLKPDLSSADRNNPNTNSTRVELHQFAYN